MYTFQEYFDYRKEFDELNEQFKLEEVALGPYDEDDEHRDKEIKQDIKVSLDSILNASKSPMTTGKKGPVRDNWRYANYAYWSQPKNIGAMKRKILRLARDTFTAGTNRATARAMLRDMITSIWQQGGRAGTITRRRVGPHPLHHRIGTDLGVSGGEFGFPTTTSRKPGAPTVPNLDDPEGEDVSKYSSWEMLHGGPRTRTGKRKSIPRYPQYA